MPMRYQYQHNAADKEGLIERAREIADQCKNYNSHDQWKAASAEMAEMMEEWRSIGNADGAHTRWRNFSDENEALWDLFSAERRHFFDSQDGWFQARKQEKNKKDELYQGRRQQKEELIRKALEAASIHDVFEADRRLEELFSTWKGVGSAGRIEDELWKKFFAIKTDVKEKKKALKAARGNEGHQHLGRDAISGQQSPDQIGKNELEGERIKRELVARMIQLCDEKNPKEHTATAKELRQAWKSSPRCARHIADELYAQFKAAEDRFWTNLKGGVAAVTQPPLRIDEPTWE